MSFQNEVVIDNEGEQFINEPQLSITDTNEDRTVASLGEKNFATLPLTGGNGVVVRSYTKSPHYLPLAMLTLVLNLPLGLPAVVCACVSRRRRLRGEEQGASVMGKAALWLSLVGIASSIVVGIFVIVYFFVMTPNIIRSIEGIT